MRYICDCGFETPHRDVMLEHGSDFDNVPFRLADGSFRRMHMLETISVGKWNAITNAINQMQKELAQLSSRTTK